MISKNTASVIAEGFLIDLWLTQVNCKLTTSIVVYVVYLKHDGTDRTVKMARLPDPDRTENKK